MSDLTHEAGDRAFMLAQIWEEYVADHVALTADAEAYRLATVATEAMHAVYQRMMTSEPTVQ